MLSDEEKEILNNIKEYMQNNIDNGYHKFIYNDLDWDFKCIDCINAIDNVLNLIEKQSKEIEELKELKEKNKTLKNLQNDTNRLYTEMIERKNYFERELQKLEDKIKAKIEEYKDKCKKCNFRGKICKEFTKNYDCVIAVCLNEFYSLLEKEE